MDDPLPKLIAALIDRLGDRALPLARNQLRRASGEPAEAWAQIVYALEQKSPMIGSADRDRLS